MKRLVGFQDNREYRSKTYIKEIDLPWALNKSLRWYKTKKYSHLYNSKFFYVQCCKMVGYIHAKKPRNPRGTLGIFKLFSDY